MRGQLSLYNYKGNSYYTVYAGRFRERPEGMIGLSLLEKVDSKNRPEIHVPTKDFCLPPEDQVKVAMKEVCRCLDAGLAVYVGCAGGQGRTGTFLGYMAKAWGIKDPINYVRDNYLPEDKGTRNQPIETRDQEESVRNFKVPFSIKWRVFKLKMAGFFESRSLTI